MNIPTKLSSAFVAILCLLTLFSSCDNDTADEDYRYMFGLTSAINSTNEEIEAIETAYCDAYRNAGLKDFAIPRTHFVTQTHAAICFLIISF